MKLELNSMTFEINANKYGLGLVGIVGLIAFLLGLMF